MCPAPPELELPDEPDDVDVAGELEELAPLLLDVEDISVVPPVLEVDVEALLLTVPLEEEDEEADSVVVELPVELAEVAGLEACVLLTDEDALPEVDARVVVLLRTLEVLALEAGVLDVPTEVVPEVPLDADDEVVGDDPHPAAITANASPPTPLRHMVSLPFQAR